MSVRSALAVLAVWFALASAAMPARADARPPNAGASAGRPRVLAGPDLTLEKRHTSAFVVGQQAPYTLVVHNIGVDTTTATVTVLDTMPAGLTYVPGAAAGWTFTTPSPQVVQADLAGVIAPGDSAKFTLTAAIDAAAYPSVTNTAGVDTTGDADPSNNGATDVTAVTLAPDLVVDKQHTGSFVYPQQGTYTLIVTNVGSAATTDTAAVLDSLPPGLDYVSAGGSGWVVSLDATGRIVTAKHGDPLAPGDTAGFALTVSTAGQSVPFVTNTASVSTPGDANPSNDRDSDLTAVLTPDLSIQKTHTLQFTVGQNAAYAISVRNVGTLASYGTYTVTDPLPPGLTYRSFTGAGWSVVYDSVASIVTASRSTLLSPGGTTVLSLTVAVGPAAFPSLTNTATVAAAGDLSGQNNSSGNFTTVAGAPNLSLDKRHLGPFVVGQTGVYRFVVRNVGSAATIAAATVTDTMPAGLTYTGDSGGWNVTWNAGNRVLTAVYAGIAAGDSATLDVTVAVDPGARPAVVNAASVTTSNDYDASDNRDVDTTAVTDVPDLKIQKRHIANFASGQNGVYTIVVSNLGPSSTAGPVVVHDALPGGLTYVSASGAGWTFTPSGQDVQADHVGTIAAGDSAKFTLTVAASAAAVPGVTNVADVSGGGDTTPGNNGASDPTIVTSGPDLTIDKRHIAPFVLGQDGEWTIVVTNTGGSATSGVISVVDSLPVGVTFDGGAGPGWSVPGPLGRRFVASFSGSIAAGDSAQFSFNAIPTPAAGSSVTNVAIVTGGGDTSPANNRDTDLTLITGATDLTLDKRHVTAFRSGFPGTYTLVVRNIGSGPTIGPVTVLDPLPPGLAFASGLGTNWSFGVNGQDVTATFSGVIAAGDSAKFNLTVDVLDAAVPAVTNSATVSGGGDVTPANNGDTDPTGVIGPPDLSIDVRHVGPFRLDNTGTYVITVTNSGAGSSIGAVTVSDTLPPGLTYLFAGGAGWFAGATGSVVTATRIASIAAGDSAQITMAVTIDAAALPAVTNAASLSGGGDATPANNRDVDVATITGQGRLAIALQGTPDEIDVGGVVDYAATVTNLGDAPVSSAEIVDVLPPGMRYLKGTTRYDGKTADDPQGAPGPVVRFSLGTLVSGAKFGVTFRVEAGPGAEIGSGVNAATARGFDATQGATSVSNTATATVRVRAGVFGDLGIIVGKVVADCDCAGDRVQGAEDLGIPGVRVVLEDGTTAVTDVEGKYSFTNLRPRLHVVRVDESTLPQGARLEPIANRDAGSAVSQFVDLKRGELHRVDFVEGSRSAPVLDAVKARRRAGEVSGPIYAGGAAATSDSSGGAGVGDGTAGHVGERGRGVLALGLLNARLDWHGLSRAKLNGYTHDRFEDELRDVSYRSDDERVEVGGRAAMLLSGHVLDSVRVMLRYDTEHEPERRLFRDIRPDEGYTMLGDASVHGFDAQTAGRLFARAERGTSYAMYGDFATPSRPERALGAFSRRLNGGIASVAVGPTQWGAFASQGHQHQVVDDFPAQGVSGPYTLSRPDGTLGSERVEIVVRDRNQPAVILRQDPQVRFVDYTLEPFTGRLVFLHPVASLDERMNPVFIRVTYESALANDAFWVYGGEARIAPIQALSIGGAAARDDDPLAPRGLTSGDATLRLGGAVTLTGETARSDSGGTFGRGVKFGRANRVEATIAVRKLTAKLRALRTDIDYDNPSAGIASGRDEQGFDLQGGLGRGATLFATGIVTKDLRTGGRRNGTQFGVSQSLPHGFRIEGAWRTSEETRTPASELSLYTATPIKSNTLNGKLTTPLPWLKQSTAFFEGEQDATWYNRHRFALGSDVRLTDKTRLFARHENVASLSGPFALNDYQQREYTVVGLTSDELENGHVFSEYRMRDAVAGREALAAIGLRNRWQMRAGLFADVGFERNVIVRGGSSAGTAATTALAYTGNPLWKGTARAEWRRQDGNDQWLTGATMERKLTRDWAALGRSELFRAMQIGRTDSRSQLGLAYRGTESNRLSALMRYDNRIENEDGPPRFRRVSHVVSSHANWQPKTRLTLAGQLASKWAVDDHDALVSRTGVYLVGGRALYDLTPRFDVGATGRSEFGGGHRFGLGGELGWLAARNLRLAGGFNLFGFRETDMLDANHTDWGPYLDLGYKFDPFWGRFGGGEPQGASR